MRVQQVMHRGVNTVQINDSIKKVAALMKREDIGSAPVYKNERPVGFVTDRDIVISCLAEGHSPDEPISLAMTRDIFFVHENDDLQFAVKMMKDHQICRLLVLDDGESPVGMISMQNLLQGKTSHETTELIKEIKR
jgi:predicted transcriptional regulator